MTSKALKNFQLISKLIELQTKSVILKYQISFIISGHVAPLLSAQAPNPTNQTPAWNQVRKFIKTFKHFWQIITTKENGISSHFLWSSQKSILSHFLEYYLSIYNNGTTWTLKIILMSFLDILINQRHNL